MNDILTYKYYDTPEGQDIWKKAFATSKYAAMGGLTLGVFDVLMYSHPKSFVSTIGRFGFYTGPLVGMASAYAVTTNAAQNFRGKNDKINYFLGGVAAGSVFGAWVRSITAAVPMALLLGFGAIVKKSAVDEGWVLLFPESHFAHKTAVSVRHDWSVAEDPVKYKTWTDGKN